MSLNFDGRPVRGARLIFITALALATLAVPARAAFPGANGKIAFAHCPSGSCDIWTMNADGTNKVDITNTPTANETSPAWSADGKQIVYVRDGAVWVMKADGTLQTQLVPAPTSNGCGYRDTLLAPAWSPDNSKIAFARDICMLDPDGGHPSDFIAVYTVNADGTGESLLANQATAPRWSPDGTKIGYEFSADGGGAYDIHWITPDGNSSFAVTQTSFEHFGDWSPDGVWMTSPSNEFDSTAYKIHPDGTGKTQVQNIRPYRWSPDGTKFLAGGGGIAQGDIYTANIDGTGVTYLTNNGNSGIRDRNPDWQPIPYTHHVRPRGATPFETYLVPAYRPCAAPNRVHGSPLSFPSCNPPVQASNFLTLGTPDANGEAAKSRGIVFLAVRPDNPPTSPVDIVMVVSISDVRNKSDLSDYTGELEETAFWRITDNYNGPSLTESATMLDVNIPVIVPCSVTADLTVGSTCAVRTTANAVIPGSVKAGKREVVGLDKVQVYDCGSDGSTCTVTENARFLTQGIFIP